MKIFLSQGELVKQLDTHHFIIGKYERDEMQPSIEAAKKIAKLVGTTVDYLLGETDEENILKDPEMLKRLNEIEKMDNEDKEKYWTVLLNLLNLKTLQHYKRKAWTMPGFSFIMLFYL